MRRLYVYEFKYTTHDGKTGTYQKQYDKLLSNQDTQKELQKNILCI